MNHPFRCGNGLAHVMLHDLDDVGAMAHRRIAAVHTENVVVMVGAVPGAPAVLHAAKERVRAASVQVHDDLDTAEAVRL